MRERDISFTGDITQDRVENLLDNLRRSPSERRVWINSAGGEFEFFSVYGPPLQRIGFTSVGGQVRSAANILYLLGHNRLALSDAQFWFHEVRAIVDDHGVITFATLEEALDREREISSRREGAEELLLQMRHAQEWGVSFICERAMITRGVFIKLMRAEAVLSAREAIHYGIVHRIVSQDELHHQ